jgi:hypothetical protein
MNIGRPLLVLVMLATPLALAGCNPTPTPRGAAYQGAPGGDVRAQNANYYLGADPDHRQRGKSGGP